MEGMYYAAPVRREGLTLYYNPLGGDCVMARSPLDLHLRLGMPGNGSMFAVWPLSRELGLTRAGELCSLVSPLRIYVVVGDGHDSQILPLASTVVQDAVMEGADGAGRD